MNRRSFLEKIAATGCAGIILSLENSAAAKAGEAILRRKTSIRKGGGKFDENLVVFISDLHCNPKGYQPEKLRKVISDILAMNPLPANVIALGDLAYLTGQISEYTALKPILQPLEDAGINLTLAMGNHDRREEFATVFPEKAKKAVRPDRMTFIVKTPKADFIVLDSLQQGDDKSTWITPGTMDAPQKEWLEKTLNKYKKPVFVCAHHPLNETEVGEILINAPACAGYIYGHHHRWGANWVKKSYSDRRILRLLCLPSTGHWGDIGYTEFRLEDTKAIATLRESEFFFPEPAKEGEAIPETWKAIMEDNKDQSCRFIY